MAIIYKITNNITGKIYVGKTINTLEYRFNSHVSNGRNIKGASKIAKSLREYGSLNHSIELLEECIEEKVFEREQYWIDKLNTLYVGYNIKNEFSEKKESAYWGERNRAKENLKRGDVWNKGISPNDSTRKKIGETRKRKHSLGLYENYGHKHTEETKKYLSEIAKKRKGPNPMSIPYIVTENNGSQKRGLTKESIVEIYNLTEREWKTLYTFCSRNNKDIHKKTGIRIDADR